MESLEKNSIVTEKLDVAYGDTAIIRDMNIEIPRGKITSVIGPNGCGKSTLLKAMGRILRPQGGQVYLNGEDLRRLSARETATKMAILPQTPTAPGGLTVSELVGYGRFPHQRGFGRMTAQDKEVIQWAMEATGLLGLQNREVDTLSGGQRQRVWIAVALAQQTDLILLDEPTTYLDLAHQLEVLQLLYRLNREQGCTIAMVLHDLNLAARFSDCMIAVREGRVVRCGSPEEVMTQEVLARTFSIDAELVRDVRTGRPSCVSYELIR
ncbi:MAG: ABC transporter ATP-binding protein [Eubacteriales bacterium]|nr:ABC transporter ATP-binding protein [Eubacteriales bacterium]